MDTLGTAQDIYPNGTIIANRYEITSFLAAGGMAQVYVANQQQINRSVALKVLSSMFSMNPNVVMRFFREAQVIGALSHPNTVRIYDMGETPDHRLFIAMELLKGEELSERIKRGPMTPAETLPIVRQVAGSLSEAHQQGIIHRDLKPDNIFLTNLNVVKVLDFGIAKLKDDGDDKSEQKLTKAGTAPGTAEYMSPEQARGKDLDARSDLYSLGIVLYEMLCGHPPFEESTFLGTILLQVQAAPPPLPESIPAALRNYIINRLLAKDPNCRPDNADIFIQEIDELSHKLKLEPSDSESEAEKEKLDNAQKEIEKLRSQLAYAKMELLKSGDCMALADLEDPPNASQSQLPPVPRELSVNQGKDSQPKIPIQAMRRPMAAPPLNGAGSRSNVPPVPPMQAPQPKMPPALPNQPPKSVPRVQPVPSGVMPAMQMPQSMPSGIMPTMGAQSVHSGVMPAMGPQSMPSGVMPTMGAQSVPSGVMPAMGPQSMPSGVMPAMGPQSVHSGVMPVIGPQSMSSGVMPAMGAQSMPSGVMPTIPVQGVQTRPQIAMRPAPQPMMRPRPAQQPPQMPNIPNGVVSTPKQTREDDEPVIPPMPRHKGRSVPFQQPQSMSKPKPAVQQHRVQSTDSLPFREDPLDDDCEDEMNVSMSSVPKDTLTGMNAMRKSKAAVSSGNYESTFMMYSQPLINKLGPSKTEEALKLALSIWNATIVGPDAVQYLLQSAGRESNLSKLILLMVNRKQSYFPNENWKIDDIIANVDSQGRLEFQILFRTSDR